MPPPARRSSLDGSGLEKYRVNLKVLLGRFSITTAYVTNDHYETLFLVNQLTVEGSRN